MAIDDDVERDNFIYETYAKEMIAVEIESSFSVEDGVSK